MKDPELPHSSSLRKGRFSTTSGLYLITKNLEQSGSLSPSQRSDVCTSLYHAREQGHIVLHAFVVMPDHWHTLFSLGDGLSLERLMLNLCRYASYPTRRSGGRISWQDGYHDRKVRQDESVVEIVWYIEGNPVKAGLVEHRSQWPWSSAHSDFASRLDRSFLGPERWRDPD